MASTDKPTQESGKTMPESEESGKDVTDSQVSSVASTVNYFLLVDFSLRLLLFASTLAAVVVMVTSKQTKIVPIPPLFTSLAPRVAKFNHSPALIYFVAALSVACLYGIISTLASLYVILKRCPSNRLLFHFILIDVLMLGIVASATGTAGAVAYIGLKGNSHVGWMKVCSVYGKFCRQNGSSIALALFASVLLVLLVMLSTYTLYRRSR